jgi:hypothetical protein
VQAYTALVGLCEDRVEDAFALLAEMKAARVRPNQFTLAALVRVCAKGGQLERVRVLLDEMFHGGSAAPTYVYNALILAASQSGGDVEEQGGLAAAMEAYGRMRLHQRKPDAVTAKYLLLTHHHHGAAASGLVLFKRQFSEMGAVVLTDETVVAALRVAAAAAAAGGSKDDVAETVGQLLEVRTQPLELTGVVGATILCPPQYDTTGTICKIHAHLSLHSPWLLRWTQDGMPVISWQPETQYYCKA